MKKKDCLRRFLSTDATETCMIATQYPQVATEPQFQEATLLSDSLQNSYVIGFELNQ